MDIHYLGEHKQHTAVVRGFYLHSNHSHEKRISRLARQWILYTLLFKKTCVLFYIVLNMFFIDAFKTSCFKHTNPDLGFRKQNTALSRKAVTAQFFSWQVCCKLTSAYFVQIESFEMDFLAYCPQKDWKPAPFHV